MLTRSYDFEQFSDADRRAELRRLHRQATVLLDLEIAHLRRLGLVPGCHVLEIGCGPGFLAGALSDAVAPGTCTGIDTSRALLEVGTVLVAPAHFNLTLLEGSAYETGLSDNAFDFVYNRLLYQHLRHPLEALIEARRVTRPGGRVCVMDVDDSWLTLDPPSPSFQALVDLAGRAQEALGGDRHVGSKLAGLMGQAGFERVSFEMVSVTSLQIGLPAFLHLTTRYKAIHVDRDEAQRLLAGVEAETGQGGVFGVVGIAVAVGSAPG